MNRRSFLKSIATVCGAAVVCPGELLKDDPWIRAAALRKKNAAMGVQWRDYHVAAHFKSEAEYEEFMDKFRNAFKNTKFKPPVSKNTKIGVGARSKHIYFMGQSLYYNEDLGKYEEGYY